MGETSIMPVGWRCSPLRYLIGWTVVWPEGVPTRHPHVGIDSLGTDFEALLLHEGDGALLHCIEPISQGAPPIHSVGEIVTDVSVDLVDGRPPLEIDIHLRRSLLEHLADDLVAIERLGAVQTGRV